MLSKCTNTLAPNLNDKDIKIYAARKSWGLIGSSACDLKILNQDYDTWERPYIDRAICYQEVKEYQDGYLLFCTNFDLKELIDIKPTKDSVYVKST